MKPSFHRPSLSYLGQRLWRGIRSHKVFYSLLSFSALMYIANATFGAYIAAYYRVKGISMGQIGILTAIGPMVTMAAQPTWGILSDKTGRHMGALRIAIAGTMCAVLSFYVANGFVGFFLAAGLHAVFGCGLQPLMDTVIVRQVAQRGYRFSAIRMGGTVGYGLCVVIMGQVLRDNPSASFGLTSMVYFIMLMVSFTVPQVEGPPPARRKLDVSKLFKNREILFIIIFVFVFQTALGFYGSFLGVYIVDLGYDTSYIGWMMLIAAAGEIPVLLVIDWALKRWRTDVLLIVASFIMAARMLLPLTSSIGWLAFSQCFQGVSYMVMYYSTVMFMNNHLEPELRGTGMAVLCVVQGGCASLFSNIVGGQIAEAFGLRSAYLFYFVVLFAFSFLCILRAVGARKREARSQAV